MPRLLHLSERTLVAGEQDRAHGGCVGGICKQSEAEELLSVHGEILALELWEHDSRAATHKDIIYIYISLSL